MIIIVIYISFYYNNYQAKRQGRGRLPYNQVRRFVQLFSQKLIELMLETTLLQGFVKARLAMFDKPAPKPSRKLVSGDKG